MGSNRIKLQLTKKQNTDHVCTLYTICEPFMKPSSLKFLLNLEVATDAYKLVLGLSNLRKTSKIQTNANLGVQSSWITKTETLMPCPSIGPKRVQIVLDKVKKQNSVCTEKSFLNLSKIILTGPKSFSTCRWTLGMRYLILCMYLVKYYQACLEFKEFKKMGMNAWILILKFGYGVCTSFILRHFVVSTHINRAL